MLIADFLFSSFNVTSLLLMFLLSYVLLASFESRNILNFLSIQFCLFVCFVFFLAYFGLELFSAILFLSELVVFFYFLLLILIKPHSLMLNSRFNFLFLVVFFVCYSYPCYQSFYFYSCVDWYFSYFSPENDVFGIYFYFYFLNWYILLSIGSLLLVTTYFICIMTLQYFSSSHSSKNLSKSNNNFFKKTQDKTYQVEKKPFFFYKYLYNGK